MTSIYLLAAVAFAGRGIDRVDFKYGSNHHLPPQMRAAVVEAPPDVVARALRRLLAAEGATLLDDHVGGGEIVTFPPDARSCWEQAMVVARLEWSAFSQGSFKAYKQIDRTPPCPELEATPAPAEVPSRKLKFEMPAQVVDARVTRRVVDGWGFGLDVAALIEGDWVDAASSVTADVSRSTVTEEVQTAFTSRLYVSLWAEGGRTQVYAWAVPTNGGIEAAPGNSIGHAWWQEVRGEREAKLVRHALEWLEVADFAGAR